MHKKYLAFDVGLRHTGVASNHGPLASPLMTLESQTYPDQLRQLAGLVDQHRPDLVILGSPGRGSIKKRVDRLVMDLDKLEIKAKVVDETLSTRIAQQRLRESGLSAPKRQAKEHQVVAALLLQDYLENLID